jgi:hypothetical protein
MAATHIKWFGAVIEFTNIEITHLTSTMNTAGTGGGLVAAVLGAAAIAGPAAIIAGVVGAILALGGAALAGCNSNGRGIVLYWFWCGVPWCRSR